MAGKRKKIPDEATSPEQTADHLPDGTDFNPEELERQLAQKQTADGILQQIADSTVLPNHISHHSPHKEPGQTHADSVGKKVYPPTPDPFGIANDYMAGIRLLDSRKHYEVQIAFQEKPSPSVIEKIKDAGGWRWKSREKVWAHRYTRDNAMTVRIEAQDLYQELREMIRAEKGIAQSHGV